MARIHILGASGSGTTTLAAAVAERMAVPHWDTDAFYWLPTDPPFTTPRPPPQRLALLEARLSQSAAWVLSGSMVRWAASIAPRYDLIVYLSLDPLVRMERLRRRERDRHGDRIAPGGDMAAGSAAFLAWAAAYDTAGREQRSRVSHTEWLAAQTAPVLRLDAAEPVQALADTVAAAVPPGA